MCETKKKTRINSLDKLIGTDGMKGVKKGGDKEKQRRRPEGKEKERAVSYILDAMTTIQKKINNKKSSKSSMCLEIKYHASK